MIEHDLTMCRCGVLLASCADCRSWLIAESPRIEAQWQVLCRWWGRGMQIDTIQAADHAEGFYRAYYLLWR